MWCQGDGFILRWYHHSPLCDLRAWLLLPLEIKEWAKREEHIWDVFFFNCLTACMHYEQNCPWSQDWRQSRDRRDPANVHSLMEPYLTTDSQRHTNKGFKKYSALVCVFFFKCVKPVRLENGGIAKIHFKWRTLLPVCLLQRDKHDGDWLSCDVLKLCCIIKEINSPSVCRLGKDRRLALIIREDVVA